MTTNKGFNAQSSDLPLAKGTFSAGGGIPNNVSPGQIPPGPSNQGSSLGGNPVLGQTTGLLVPGIFVNDGLPDVLQLIAKLAVQWTSFQSGGSIRFTLWVQRRNLLNALDVTNEGAIPQYGTLPQNPVPTSITTGIVPIDASGPGGVQQVVADFSTTPWQVVSGDVYYLVYDFPSAPPTNPQNVMASLG